MTELSVLKGWISLILVLVGLTAEARAIQRDYGARTAIRQSAGGNVSIGEFSPDSRSCLVRDDMGQCETFLNSEFEEPLFGVFFSRQGLTASIAYGKQKADNTTEDDLELLETVIRLSGALRPFPGSEESDVQFVVPVALHSDYRRLSADSGGGPTDRFESTVLAIGAGLGVIRPQGYTRFSASVMPFFGLASSSFGLGSGTSSLVNANADLTLGPLSGSLGLAIGYTFRWQKWNLEEQFIANADFTTTQHAVRLGVFW